MDARRGEDGACMRVGDRPGTRCRGQRFTDADERSGAGRQRAIDYEVTIGVERGIGEMRVTIDELHGEKTRTAAKATVLRMPS